MHGQVEDHFERMIHDRTVRVRRDGSADSILSQKGIRIACVARVSFCFRRKKKTVERDFLFTYLPHPLPALYSRHFSRSLLLSFLVNRTETLAT